VTEALLQVRELSRSFGSLKAVDRVSFDVMPGQVVGFIGPNGSGKTTTMRVIATLDIPDSGDVLIGGDSVLDAPRRARDRIGFMSDRFEPFAFLDVAQYLDFFARAQGLRGQARLTRVEELAELCGLTGFLTRPTTGLSKGMAQRLHLAKTLIHDPQLLVLDEPANGLDPRARIELRELLAQLAAQGKSILISSHILTELAESCDSIVVIERGRLVVSGAIDSIAARMQDAGTIVVRVLGDPLAARTFFAAQASVRDLSLDDHVLSLRIDGDDDTAADLLAAAIGAGLRITEFTRRSADLEQIFLSATRGELQ
jgi:ABC-2 type transport system ATP-binding protein